MNDAAFLLEALVYLAAAVIAVPLSKRLGLGSVLGYLVAGIAIGPSALGLISDVASVRPVSELGVVLLLFLVGLELEPKRLWALRRAIFGLGTLQLVVTVAAVAAALAAAGLAWPLSIAVGCAVAMSSTAIALQVLAERNLVHTEAGRSAFAVSLFQDLAVIPMMLGLALLAPVATVAPATAVAAAAQATGGASSIDLLRIGTALGLVVAMVAAGRLLLRPLLRMVAATGLREVFVACALLLVVGSAWLTQSVGLSLAMGAFMAGVLLADSEYRIELLTDIEPFKGLLLGLFFIAVGMSIDLALVAAQPLRIVSLAAAAVLAKLIVLLVLARAFKLCRADGWVFALSICGVGEFAFVLSSVSRAEGLLAPADAALLDAVVACSMLATPLLFLAYERVLAPRYASRAVPPVPRIDERNAVIVAGIGRFGQVVARLLIGRGVPVTIIDHDPAQIELLRQFGWRLHYGDAARPDVLEAAGAAQARLLVLAIDDPDTIAQVVRHAQRHYPQLTLVARARGRTDAYRLAELGVPFVRETFGSALDAAEAALVALGTPPDAARRAAATFRRHDEKLLADSMAVRADRAQLVSLNLQARRDLEQLLREEQEQQQAQPGPL